MNKLLKARWELGYQIWNMTHKVEPLFDTHYTANLLQQDGDKIFQQVVRHDRVKLGEHYYYAGGCIRSKWDGLQTKDYDIYVYREENIHRLVGFMCRYQNYKVVRRGPVTTLNNTIQFIHTDAPPETLLKTFDFRCNQFAYDGKVIATPEAQIDASLKILRFNPTFVAQRSYSFKPLQRTWHFRRRGYTVPDETIEMAYKLALKNRPNSNWGGPR